MSVSWEITPAYSVCGELIGGDAGEISNKSDNVVTILGLGYVQQNYKLHL
jgi:hypothetical protein